MKTICVIIILALALGTCFGDWELLPSPTMQVLNGVAFSALDSGYVVGDNNAVFRTMNGGETWDTLFAGTFPECYWHTVSCPVSFSNAYLIGHRGSGGDAVPIGYITTTCGSIWEPDPNPVGRIWNYTHQFKAVFPISSTGYAILVNGPPTIVYNNVLKTLNGGSSWIILRELTESSAASSIYFRNNSTGYLAYENGWIFKTTDGGSHWAGPMVSHTTRRINGIFFINANEGLIVGDAGIILRSTNTGIDWLVISSGVESNLKDVCFPNNGDNGIIVGEEGIILSSSDRGLHWHADTSPTPENLSAISFPPRQDSQGYIVGSNGTVLKNSRWSGIKEEDSNSALNTIKVAPSPFHSFCLLNVPAGSKVEIYNIEGIKVGEPKHISNTSWHWEPTTKQPCGLYYFDVNLFGQHQRKAVMFLR